MDEKTVQLVFETYFDGELRGVDRIIIPGEEGDKRKQEILKRGWIEIDDKVIEELKAML